MLIKFWILQQLNYLSDMNEGKEIEKENIPKYTQDSMVNLRLSIREIIDMHNLLYNSYILEPHDIVKADVFNLMQDFVVSMMRDLNIKNVVDEIYEEARNNNIDKEMLN